MLSTNQLTNDALCATIIINYKESIVKELSENAISNAAIFAEVKFMQENRVNFSAQADEVIEKVKRGEKSNEADYFILLHTNQEKIDEAVQLQDVKDRMAKGRLRHDDIDFLITTMGGVGEFDTALKNAFYIKVDQMNLAYAQEHPDEFEQFEINEMNRRVVNNKSVYDSLQEDIRSL